MKDSRTQYAVARGEKIIGELRDSIGDAKDDLAGVESSMHAAALEPDVHLVYVEATTTYSRPKVYRDPTPEEAAEAQIAQDNIVLPASGVWGDDSGPEAA